ncbi:hypothetical protein LCGC14_0355790 [marine sediment metagenome]|uniref:Recombination endonuclease VII n=1 Tax=marine sediment metagenome TaxID=412755 RepID=A0A0F9TSC1_9ZZZZ
MAAKNKRRCYKCKKELSSDKFGNDKYTPTGKSRACKKCVNVVNKKYREANKGSYRGYSLERSYNITVEEYDQMLEVQNGVCAICHKPETAKIKNGVTRRLAIDHDHETDTVRELLCHRCNLMLGCAQDNTVTLLEAAIYLERHHN